MRDGGGPFIAVGSHVHPLAGSNKSLLSVSLAVPVEANLEFIAVGNSLIVQGDLDTAPLGEQFNANARNLIRFHFVPN